MANTLEVSRDIVIAAINNGLIHRPNKSGQSIEETNQLTAEAVGKFFDTVFEKVNNRFNQR